MLTLLPSFSRHLLQWDISYYAVANWKLLNRYQGSTWGLKQHFNSFELIDQSAKLSLLHSLMSRTIPSALHSPRIDCHTDSCTTLNMQVYVPLSVTVSLHRQACCQNISQNTVELKSRHNAHEAHYLQDFNQ